MLGGLFIANDVQAQANNLMQTQQPVTNWISSQQALAIATVEVENLTAQVQQMKNNGVSKPVLNKAKAELRFWSLTLKALQNGMSTEESFKIAWANFGGSATGIKTPYSIQEAEALYNKVLDKLTD
jgi:hypothetical protein